MQQFLKTNTYRFMAIAIVAPLVLGSAVLSGETGSDGSECPIEKKVTALLSSWKAAGDEASALSPAERKNLQTRLAGLAKDCPVGSRVGVTLASVRDVLGAVIASTEENSKHCPLENVAAKDGAASEACADARKLKEGRAKALRHLHQLASYGAAAAPVSACCAASTQTATATAKPGVVSAAKGESCAATRTIELAVRVGALQASWKVASQEVASISPAEQRQKLTSMAELAQRSRAVALMPSTVIALADGFDVLETIDGKMFEWARANPAIFESVPEAARKSFAEQAALIHQTREVLTRARSALKTAMGSCAHDAGKIETASKS